MKRAFPRLLSLAAIVGLTLAAGSAGAATIVIDFHDGTKIVPLAGGLTATNLASFQSASVADPFTFRYNISGLGIAGADELLITVDTVSSTANFSNGGGNGIAVVGGGNNAWWDPLDPNLSFSVVVEDALNNDITSGLTIDLTGFVIRWKTGGATVAGQSISTTLASPDFVAYDLNTGETSETSFTAARTTGDVGQIGQLRFTIVPEPSSLLLGSLGMIFLLRRRR